jgi:hypothetical protein
MPPAVRFPYRTLWDSSGAGVRMTLEMSLISTTVR